MFMTDQDDDDEHVKLLNPVKVGILFGGVLLAPRCGQRQCSLSSIIRLSASSHPCHTARGIYCKSDIDLVLVILCHLYNTTTCLLSL